jgi:hypothetical protein
VASALQPVLELAARAGRPKAAANNPPIPDADHRQQALEELQSLLRHADAATLALFAEIEPWLSQLAPGLLLNPLRRQIEHYEFEDAGESLRKIADALSIALKTA